MYFLNYLKNLNLSEKPLVLSIVLNVVFFTLYICFGERRFGSLDDFFMSSVLVGAYGGHYDVHLYFINAIYGYILKPFYLLFPSVGWYSLGESFEVFASFVAIIYCVLKSVQGRWGIVFSLLVLGCVEPIFWPNIGFTQCSAALSAAGVLLASQSILQGKKRIMVFAVVFLIAGYVMRKEMFLLCTPALGLVVFFSILKRKAFCLEHLIILAVGIFAIACLNSFDKNLYKADGYEQYAAYQGPRAYFGDGGFYDLESAYDEMKERNLCAYDLRMLRAWYFYDKEAFSLDSLYQKARVVSRNRYDVNYLKLPLVTILAVSRSLSRSDTWCWLVLCLVFIFGTSSKFKYLPWVSLALVFLSYGYMLMVNRLAGHVEVGAWLYANVTLLAFVGTVDLKKLKPNSVWAWGVFAIALISVINCLWHAIPAIVEHGPVITNEQPAKWKNFEEYAQSHPNDAFLLSFEDYKTFATAYTLPHGSIVPGSWNNIFTMGYWNIYLPTMETEMHARGMYNPIKDVTLPNVYVIDSQEPMLPAFFEAHYHQKLIADTVEMFDDIPLLKYSIEAADEKN